jgi:hypothetical protein
MACRDRRRGAASLAISESPPKPPPVTFSLRTWEGTGLPRGRRESTSSCGSAFFARPRRPCECSCARRRAPGTARNPDGARTCSIARRADREGRPRRVPAAGLLHAGALRACSVVRVVAGLGADRGRRRRDRAEPGRARALRSRPLGRALRAAVATDAADGRQDRPARVPGGIRGRGAGRAFRRLPLAPAPGSASRRLGRGARALHRRLVDRRACARRQHLRGAGREASGRARAARDRRGALRPRAPPDVRGRRHVADRAAALARVARRCRRRDRPDSRAHGAHRRRGAFPPSRAAGLRRLREPRPIAIDPRRLVPGPKRDGRATPPQSAPLRSRPPTRHSVARRGSRRAPWRECAASTRRWSTASCW